MVVFLSPLWLWMLAPIVLTGVLALWRGRHNHQRISSTLLWQSLGGEATERKHRRIDPVWLGLFGAAMLTTLALGSPLLRWGGDEAARPAADVQISMRALGGAGQGEVFVKVANGRHLPATLEVVLSSRGRSERRQSIGTAELAAGKIIDAPKEDVLWVGVTADGRGLGSAKLTRVAQPRLVVYRQGQVSPALRRAMDVQPGTQLGEEAGAGRPVTILLVGGQTAGEETGAAVDGVALPEHDALVVFTANHAPGELGVKGGAWVGAGATLLPTAACTLPRSVWRGDLPAGRYRAATLTDAWTVLVRAGSGAGAAPYVAVRRDDERNVSSVYVASTLAATEKSWPADPTFVMLMSDLVNQVRPPTEGAQVTVWTCEMTPAAVVAAARQPLGGAFIVAAATLILISVMLLVRRVRT